MDISSISSGVVTQNMQQRVGDAVGVSVAKKALDIEKSLATQLINSVADSQPPPVSEPHLGNRINVHA